jgi:MYXO-CTERM domain-containing protein
MKNALAVRLAAVSAGLMLTGALYLGHAPEAHACGCFAPPDPTVPVVQAGEAIAFHMDGNKVTAHIQIAYKGKAEEFGWLLPVDAVPTLEVGTDELFVQLISTTQPVYRLQAEYNGNCPFDPNRGLGNGGGGASSPAEDGDDSGGGGGGGYDPLVIRDTVGPYDYAVLRADQKQPMLDWLDENGFFVPAGTDGVVDAYIRPGAYFLALKLLKGNDAGDIQPVVVQYESSLPMIPIVLTSVAADPDMPILVWVLGNSRAIPRNYYHTEINDAELNWLGFADNYLDVINRAVDEANEHQSFVTEYAGSSSVMQNILDYPGRFGDLDALRATTDAINYVEYLTYNGYTTGGNTPPLFQATFTSQVLGILQSELPVPRKILKELRDQGQTASAFYIGYRYYVETDAQQRPEMYEDLDTTFDAVELTQQLEEKVVVPTRKAAEMFNEHRYLTRMYTTLSPSEMTRDPVFSFNPDLADVTNVHTGRLIYYCGLIPNDDILTTPAVVVTEDGWELSFPHGTGENPWGDVDWPNSHYIQAVREEGPPENVVDNTDAIFAAIQAKNGDGGCSVGGGAGGGFAGLLLLGLIGFVRRRRS